jgi:predicted esterase YcpF (UPF0227 family)
MQIKPQKFMNQVKNKTCIFHFHGFNSNGNSGTAEELKRCFGDVEAPSYDYIQPDVAFHEINELILSKIEQHNILFSGTSLGGFWAYYFSGKYNCSCVLINPALKPSVLMMRRTQENSHINFNDPSDIRNLSAQDVLEYEKYENEIAKFSDLIDRWILLGANDTNINHLETYHALSDNNYNHIIIDENEGHQINDKNKIIAKVKEALEFLKYPFQYNQPVDPAY